MMIGTSDNIADLLFNGDQRNITRISVNNYISEHGISISLWLIIIKSDYIADCGAFQSGSDPMVRAFPAPNHVTTKNCNLYLYKMIFMDMSKRLL